MPIVSHTCEVCGVGALTFAFPAKDRNRAVDAREFNIMRCAECGIGHTIPKLSAADLSRYYTHEYYSLDSNLALEAATRPYNQARIKAIRRFVERGKLLDIGAGTGMFLKAAQESGFDAEGLEMSEDAAAFGRRQWNLNIRQGNLLDAHFPEHHYDAVTLSHVFEHLHEPRRVAVQLHAMLKPGGLLMIAVPNFASMQARLFGSRWFHLDVPRHVFHYSPQALTRLIETVGFRVVETNYFSAEHNWAGILGSVMRLSRPGESFPHKVMRKLLGMPIAKALAFAESALGRGGTFALYAIKQ